MTASLRQGLKLFSFALFLVVVLCGCESREVAQDLSQREATQIVALLNESGIVAFAEKQKGGKSAYSVSIDEAFYPQAVSLLHRHNLPGEKKPTVAEIVGSSGFLPGSREIESMRLDYALSTQLEEMIAAHPNVERAKASVRLHTMSEGKPPAAGLVVQLRDEQRGPNIDQLIQIAQKAIPGIPADQISIMLSGGKSGDAEISGKTGVLAKFGGGIERFPLTRFLWFWQVPQQHYTTLALALTGIVLVVGIAAAGLGYWTCLYQKTRDGFETNLPEVIPRNIRGDRKRSEVEE